MDEPSLHDLLERATVPEPPLGPVAQNALRAGLAMRRRRHAWYTATGAATVAVACAAALAVTATTSHQSAANGKTAATIYVVSEAKAGITITPVPAATDKPGKPIVVDSGNFYGNPEAVLSPDGKTIWVSGGSVVTPFSTATNTVGRKITLRNDYVCPIVQLLVTPNGKTVYANGECGTVTPISTTTDRPGKPIIRTAHAELTYTDMAITPDGKTLYFLNTFRVSTVIPVDTRTDRPGKPINTGIWGYGIAVPPHGSTAYVVGRQGSDSFEPVLTPFSTATNRPGKTISVGANVNFIDFIMAPEGHVIYMSFGSHVPVWGVIPFFTDSNTFGKTIALPAAPALGNFLGATPDGGTVYAVTILQGAQAKSCSFDQNFTPIMTATGTLQDWVHVGCVPKSVAITPDGRTAYLAAVTAVNDEQSMTTVMPVATATGHAGKAFRVNGSSVAVLITP